MSITMSKKLLFTLLKSVLQIAAYMLIGLMLAFFINSTAQAAEIDDTTNPPNNIEDTAADESDNFISELPPLGDEYTELPSENVPLTGRLLIISRANGTGVLLHGAVFDVRRAVDDEFMAQIATNQFGEAFFDLPEGDYYLREVIPPSGYLHDSSRINVTVYGMALSEVVVWSYPIPEQPQPTPTPTQTPNEQAPTQGRLLVTSRAQGTNELLRGAIFEIRRAIDDVFVAQIVADRFGEASVNLPAGDYFLREISPPTGFIANPNRVTAKIQADKLTEINVTNKPIEPETEPTIPAVTPDGRLLIINKAQSLGTGGREQGTGENLSNAIFEVRTVMDDRLISQMQTNQFGEAAVNLPAGDYYIRQIVPASGYVLDSARTAIKIKSGELFSLLVISVAETAPETVTEAEPPADGRLLVTLVSSATGERISNGTITIHDVMTDAHIITLTSNNFGEASVFLPAGRYFMRQSSMPQGYLSNLDRIPFTIKAGDITDMNLAVRAEPTPAPTATPPPTQTQSGGSSTPPPVIETTTDNNMSNQGRIEIITRAAGSGNLLSGGIFAIYNASDNRRVGELTTGAGGMAYLMAEPGMYYIRELRPTYGFYLETERIFLEVGAGETVKMELTKVRDLSISDLPIDEDGGGIINITQTGQFLSMFHYMGGGFMLIIAIVCVGLAVWEFIKKKPGKEVLQCG